MRQTASFARQAAGLTFQPRAAWPSALDTLRTRPALLWQAAGALACVVLLSLRASGLANTNPAFAGSGGGILVTVALALEAIAYLLYIPLGAWVVTTVLRPAHPDLGWRRVLRVFSYSTLPLLAGWVLRGAVAWVRPAGGVAAAGDFHRYLELLWSAVTLRADVGLLLGSGTPLLASASQALGLFWVWHAVVLWGGLDELTEGSRRWVVAALATLFGLVLVAQLLEGVAALQWPGLVTWSE